MDIWDKMFENEINQAITQTTKFYNELKYKAALKSGFFELLNFKEDYLISKNGKAHPHVLMTYIQA